MIDSGSLDSVPGFKAAGTACGIKINGGPDLAVLLCDRPCAAAGVFTTNRLQAAPVAFCKRRLENNPESIRAIVVNSGNANACTGEQGLRDAGETAAQAERAFGLGAGSVLVMSTGIIGVPLPLDKIKTGLRQAAKELGSGPQESFSRAILTTDTREKTLALSVEIGGASVTLAAAAKGSGMIHPNLATMLVFFATDAAITPGALKLLLGRAAARTFNLLSVDGDRSPNDSVFILASGASGAPLIENESSRGFETFYEALLHASTILARMIAADGEGATRLVEIRVVGADSFDSAARVARAVANSPLVKTAIFGGDPNWGRIVSAAGSSGVEIDPERIDVYFGAVQAVSRGAGSTAGREELAAELKKSEIIVTIGLNQGRAECRFFTCDLSYDYVRINADYHT